MDSRNVTPEMAEKLLERVGPMLQYFHRLRERMEKRRFNPTDPLYIVVCETFDKLHHLNGQLHYLTCKSGVGRPERPR